MDEFDIVVGAPKVGLDQCGRQCAYTGRGLEESCGNMNLEKAECEKRQRDLTSNCGTVGGGQHWTITYRGAAVVADTEQSSRVATTVVVHRDAGKRLLNQPLR